MRVALVTARHMYDNPFEEAGEIFESLGLEYIAAVLRAEGIDVDLFNEQLEEWNREDLVKALSNSSYKIVGFSGNYSNTKSALEIAKALPDGIHICFGGYSATLFPHEILTNPFVDSLIVGDGEHPFLELTKALEHKGDIRAIPNVLTKDSSSLRKRCPVNLAHYPQPVRDEIEKKHFLEKSKGTKPSDVALVSASRGCPGNCHFCYANKFFVASDTKTRRYRDVMNLVDEMEQLYHSPLQTRYFWFTDEDFIGRDPERIYAFIQEVTKRKLLINFEFDTRAESVDYDLFAALKDIGLGKVFVGIESFAQSFLDRWNKQISVEQNTHALDVFKRLGIDVMAGTIFFDRLTTLEELAENAHFLEKYDYFYLNDIGRCIKTYITYDQMETQYPKDPRCQRICEEIQIERNQIFRRMISQEKLDLASRLHANRELSIYFTQLVRAANR